jgi:hypothetical protein
VVVVERLLPRVQFTVGQACTVVISDPSAWIARTVQLFTLRPLSSTVHAPQLEVSQPITVPVRPSRVRR